MPTPTPTPTPTPATQPSHDPTSSSSSSSSSGSFAWLRSERVRQAAAGGGAGAVSAIITCPLDMLKIRLQNDQPVQASAQHSAQHSASASASASASRPASSTTATRLVSIWATEGITGLYRGVGATAAGYLPTWAIYFSVYEWAKDALQDLLGLSQQTTLVHILAASQAGAISTLVTNPLWVVRTRIMTQPRIPAPDSPYYYTSVLNALSTIYRQEGWIALYKGLGPSLVGVSHVAIQFPLYERLKIVLQDENGKVSGSWILFASAASKMAASSATYPHEVIRTRLQTQLTRNRKSPATPSSSSDLRALFMTPPSAHPPAAEESHRMPKYRGLLQSARVILREEGVYGFYSGFGTSLVRTVPASALTIWTYELLSAWLKRLADQ
ncbi:mitochondrial carrier domain-containing protein [Entophlyctis helioformis]|nr:mitochondrial carrier domain-containing protein [Entophlyctis helioformis]